MARVARPFHDATADETVVAAKVGNIRLEYLQIAGIDAVDSFIQLFDEATTGAVNLGTTVPVVSYFVPAGNATVRGGFTENFDPPLDFQRGLVYAVTTTVGGNTGPTTPLELNMHIS